MFSAEVIVKPTDNRRSPRTKVDMPAQVTGGTAWRTVCRIADISRHGARLGTYSALPKGTVIWLSMPGEPARKAEIVWSDEYNAACKFMVPLDEMTVVTLVGRFGFNVEPDRPVETMVMVA